ncbi:MAG: hypothetical protein UR52_C0006G0008 [Candidatus Gottesmanbacteria bacterium GW2011_GWA1_34_13]|uniref:Uncharacterized protein n=1 Tax=Candidatus Gottesmanbacteria bacterium GW2011_GWA1_34_13 TaxID=1618434 RepID=A0A0G0AR68_9BACT|nr:MAG: hypothetical protein UR52_C0006G0008 [Candidatus Gottesmanbacteria bacterium GW2011_GWA1_34_13]
MITDKDIIKLKQVFSTKDDLEMQLSPIKKDLKTIKKDIKQIKQDVKSTLKYVDQQDKTLRFRTKRIEKHLHLPEIPYITT